MYRILFTLTLTSLLAHATLATQTVDFDDLTLPGSESFENGSGLAGGFTSHSVGFNNNYNAAWGSWDGFAYSNMSDTTTPGFGNQHSAFPGSGAGTGDDIYSVGFIGFAQPPTITLPVATVVQSALFTNTTYAALSMRDGDAFSKKFGGAAGDDEDWLRLTITGHLGANTTGTVDFYLADYRFADNNLDYILDQWTQADLTSLGTVDALTFGLASSDVGAFGINTPTYFALDNLVVNTIPEPTSLILMSLAGLAILRRRHANKR